MIRFRAIKTTVLLEEIARIYRDDIWKIHKVPKKILSNKGYYLPYNSWKT